MIIVQEFTE